MHEPSISLSIVEVPQEDVTRLGDAQVEAVHLRLGALSGVVKDALLCSYEPACEQTPLDGSRLLVEEVPVEVPVIVYCPQRQEPRNSSSIQFFACDQCGTSTPEVLQGREIEVYALEIQE